VNFEKINTNIFIYFLIIINVIFTFYYTFYLIRFSFRSSKLSSYQMFYEYNKIYLLISFILAISSLFFGYIYLRKIIFLNIVSIPILLKFIPQIVLFLILIINIINLRINLFSNNYLNYYI